MKQWAYFEKRSLPKALPVSRCLLAGSALCPPRHRLKGPACVWLCPRRNTETQSKQLLPWGWELSVTAPSRRPISQSDALRQVQLRLRSSLVSALATRPGKMVTLEESGSPARLRNGGRVLEGTGWERPAGTPGTRAWPPHKGARWRPWAAPRHEGEQVGRLPQEEPRERGGR